MKSFVVDSGIAAKWYLREPDTDLAMLLLDHCHKLFAPHFIHIEFSNVLWKKCRSGQLTPSQANDFHDHFKLSGVSFQDDGALAPHALAIATVTGRTVYDCMYIALAQALRCPMVTADLKLSNALANSDYSTYVLALPHLRAAL